MPQREPRTERRFALSLAAIGVGALAARVAYVLMVGRDLQIFGDARTYYLLAENLANGLGYIRPDQYESSGAIVPTAEFPPLFPALLSIAMRLGVESVVGLKLVLSVFGSLTVVAIGVLGRLAAGAAVGLVAAALAAVYPMLFQAEAALMPETIYALLVTLGLIAAYRAIETGHLAWWVVTGTVLGLATLTRAEALFLAPLLALGLLRRDFTWRRCAAALGVLAAAGAAVVAPWTVRNALRLEHFVPVSNNFGGLVLGANCPPTYAGRDVGLWRFECYERVDGTGLDETERARAYLDEGLEYARSRPGRAAAVAGVRLLRIWGAWDPDGQMKWETFEGRSLRWQTIGHRTYAAFLLLAAVGTAASIRERRRLWPLGAVVVLVSMTAVLSYGNQRFRIAAEPAIVVLAAVGAVTVLRRLRGESE